MPTAVVRHAASWRPLPRPAVETVAAGVPRPDLRTPSFAPQAAARNDNAAAASLVLFIFVNVSVRHIRFFLIEYPLFFF